LSNALTFYRASICVLSVGVYFAQDVFPSQEPITFGLPEQSDIAFPSDAYRVPCNSTAKSRLSPDILIGAMLG
jgi:hypothetical protein